MHLAIKQDGADGDVLRAVHVPHLLAPINIVRGRQGCTTQLSVASPCSRPQDHIKQTQNSPTCWG